MHWSAEHLRVQVALGCRQFKGAGTGVAAIFAAGWKCASEQQGQTTCWGRLGRDAGAWLSPGLAGPGPSSPSQDLDLHFSLWLLGKGCPVQQRRESERAGLLACLSALAYPISLHAGGGCREGSVPMRLQAHEPACKSAMRARCLTSAPGSSQLPLFMAQPSLPCSPLGASSGAHAPPYQHTTAACLILFFHPCGGLCVERTSMCKPRSHIWLLSEPSCHLVPVARSTFALLVPHLAAASLFAAGLP